MAPPLILADPLFFCIVAMRLTPLQINWGLSGPRAPAVGPFRRGGDTQFRGGGGGSGGMVNPLDPLRSQFLNQKHRAELASEPDRPVAMTEAHPLDPLAKLLTNNVSKSKALAASALDGAERVRLDALLVQLGFCSSRVAAKEAIEDGRVTVAGVKDSKVKAGLKLEEDHPIKVTKGDEARYVSRAGEKLEFALQTLKLNLTGASVLDVGASTGGFTDCALQWGAASVVCVDVGHGQLVKKLENDPRVTSLEGVNARNLNASMLPRETYDFIVVDVSFISLTLVLPAVWQLLNQSRKARLIALVKPQFEAGKEAADKGKGIIRDPNVHEEVQRNIERFAEATLPDCRVVKKLESPILGGDGNREFLQIYSLDSLQRKAKHKPTPESERAAAAERGLKEAIRRGLVSTDEYGPKKRETAASRKARANNRRAIRKELEQNPPNVAF